MLGKVELEYGAEGLGDEWTEISSQAWQGRVARIMAHVQGYESRLSKFKA